VSIAGGFCPHAALTLVAASVSESRSQHKSRSHIPSAEDKPMRVAFIPALTAVSLILMGATESWSQPICRPTLAFTEAHYEPIKLPRLERTWTVAFTVDASRCATDSGSFSILFTVWKENAPDTDYVENFKWIPDLNVISKEFWADEAVGAYKVKDIAPCPCSGSKQ
jgi:hypothetical protein